MTSTDSFFLACVSEVKWRKIVQMWQRQEPNQTEKESAEMKQLKSDESQQSCECICINYSFIPPKKNKLQTDANRFAAKIRPQTLKW